MNTLLVTLLLAAPAFAGCLEAPENLSELKVALGVRGEAPPAPDAPIARASSNATLLLVGEAVLLSAATSRDPQGLDLTYRWDLGDGQHAEGRTLTHAYTSAGTYLVRLTITNDAGLSDTDGLTVTVVGLDKPPVARAAATPAEASVGDHVTFDANGSYDPEGGDLRYVWDFGDGVAATTPQANHAFAQPGRHTVSLTVIDDAGLEATTSVLVPVNWQHQRAGTLTVPDTRLNATLPVPEPAEALSVNLTFDGGAGVDLSLEVRDANGRLVDGVGSGPTVEPAPVTLALDLADVTAAWGEWTVSVVRHGGATVAFTLTLDVGYHTGTTS